ncbi:M48 family metallopeptidase [Candidatus Sumerlaeota bacterium]|nr:M48 family metallopeptidase [Candidatus Sumerlaeota bacterium]
MQEAKRYETLRLSLSVLATCIELAYLLVAYWSGFSLGLKNLVESLVALRSLQIALFVGLLFGIIEIILLPVSCWRGWILPRRFNLSHQTFAHWCKDYLKSIGLSFLIIIIVVESFYLFIRETPQLWWLSFSMVLILFMVILAKLMPVLILPIFLKSEPLEDGELKSRLEELSRQVIGTPLPVYVMHLSEKTRSATAMIAGIGSTRRIYLADTLLQNFSPEEVCVISAHEMGHHHYRHLWKALALQSAMIILTMALLSLFVSRMSAEFPSFNVSDLAVLPLIIVAVSVVFFFLHILVNIILRRSEMQADEFAVRTTHLRYPFISAMQKLAELNLANPDPSSIVEFLFYSHPSLKKRIDFIQTIDLNESTH